MTQYNRFHYNSVTDAWVYIFGKNFHYGYFESDDVDLDSATTCLIDGLVGMADIIPNSKILDVGCGIGEPALYLHKKYAYRITGISISERGVYLGTKAAEELGCQDKVRFQVRDALDNGFPQDSFDVVWQMESSHLMRNKTKLFSENFRVLKNSGILLLCDLILDHELNVADLYRCRKELGVLEKSFGKTKMETMETYVHELKEAGFSDIKTVDISNQVLPTLKHWQKNMAERKTDILEYLTLDEFNNFLLSCDILDNFFRNNILGYGLVRAQKAEQKIDE